jgi:hypothetical protein
LEVFDEDEMKGDTYGIEEEKSASTVMASEMNRLEAGIRCVWITRVSD